MRTFRNLLQLFDRRERIRLAAVCLMLFVGSFVEIAGIGLILPFIKIVGAPEIALQHSRFGPWLARLGIISPKHVIVGACILLVAVSLFKAAYVAISMRISYRFIYGKVVSLSERLFDSYLRTSYLFHLRNNTAGLIRNTTIEPEYVGGMLKYALFLPTEIMVVTGLAIMMFVAEPVTSLIGAVFMALVVGGLSVASRRRLSRLGRTRAEEHTLMIRSVNQGLGGIKEIKLLNREDFFVEALATSGRRYADALCQSTLLAQYPRVAIEAAAALVIVVFVLVVVLSGRDMNTALGTLALFGVATVRLVPSSSRILNSMSSIRFYGYSITSVLEGVKAGNNAREVIPSNGPSVTLTTRLELRNLSYRYPGSTVDSLDVVNLEISRGQRIAFVGASGAGKTTLANIILGLIEPTAGSVLVDGINIHGNLRDWQRRLGYIPQEIYLIDDTIRRNVAFGLPDAIIDDAAVWKALESAQLAEFVRGLHDRLGAIVGERGARISAGQRQRIGIARALYHDPDVLVLDEATSALDNETERSFAASITALERSKTVLIIAHRLSTVRECDEIFMLDQGRLVGSGTYDGLFVESAGFARLVNAERDHLVARV